MKKTKKSLIVTIVATAFLAAAGITQAQQVYFQNFDTDDTANWTVNASAAGNPVNFFYDYSLVGIPSAPHSTGGSTRGMKMQANVLGTAVFGGVSVSPTGQSFVGDYELHADVWWNFNGPMPGGGSGSTQLTGVGVGTAGTTAQWAGGTQDSIHFSVTGDGGSGTDYRAYSSAAPSSYGDASPVYAAGAVTGNRNNSFAYYSGIGGVGAPAAQLSLYPNQTGNAAVGAPAFAWHEVVVKKIGNNVTYSIDGLLIATVDASTVTLGGNNILFYQSDINATSSTDTNSTDILFGLIDNVRVTNLAATVSVTVPQSDAGEGGVPFGQFTLTRVSDNVAGPLTVNYTITGTADNGTDYTNQFGVPIPTSVTFAAGETTTNINVIVINDSVSELTETVVLTVVPGPGYAAGLPASGTVNIADNDAQLLKISGVRTNMYESSPYDYCSILITRYGNLNVANSLVIDPTNIVFSGTATSNADFVLANLPVSIDPGSTGAVVNLVMPLNDSLQEGTETIVIGLAPNTDVGSGASYAVSNATATVNILDDEYVTPERILFSDTLNGDSSLIWKTNFAANNAIDDYRVLWGYDLATDGVTNAPNGSTTALKLTVNKDDPNADGAAALNLYPIGKSFSNNFALRFNAYLTVSGGATTEFAIFGVNHSGTKTNWNLQNGAGSITPLDSDGYWCAASADGSGSAPGDYCLFRGNGAGVGALQLATASGTLLTGTFKSPPFEFEGGLGNFPSSATPSWVNVEIRNVNNTRTWRINNQVIINQTNATNYASGDVMLGYMDPYMSIGSGGAVYYSNVRVVDLTPLITSVVNDTVANKIKINFNTLDLFDTAGSFALQSATDVTGPYTDDGAATITLQTTGYFQASITPSGPMRYYRIHHL